MIDTAALREKVLDLAIRGKLVPQDPNDEPASVLLERIHEQKLQMVREGKLKAKDVKDDTIIFNGDDNCYYEKFSDGSVKNIQDEIPFDLPEGWGWARGKNCFQEMKTRKPNGEEFVYIDIDAIDNKKNTITNAKALKVKDAPSRACRYVECGSVLFSLVRPYLKNIAFVEEKYASSIASSGFFVCTSTGVLYPRYSFYLMISPYVVNGINQFMKGDNSPSVSKSDIENWLYPIPPYNEQKQIVDCLNKILAIIQNIHNTENELQGEITSIKSKILELAIQGKLVPQDENDEPASVLLERIRAERKAKLGKKYVESYIFKGEDNCYYENMPKNWVKCRLSDIADLERGITFSASAKETIKTKKNIACIRTANVQDELDLDDLIYVDRAYTKNNERKLLRVGDIIMSSANSKELVGKSCIVKHFDGEMTFGGFVLVIRSIQIIPEFLLICLKYLFLKGAFYNESTQTTNIANISTKIIESLEISLPPLMEQQRIINKITTLFTILKDGV